MLITAQCPETDRPKGRSVVTRAAGFLRVSDYVDYVGLRRRRLALVRVLIVPDAPVVLIAALDGPLLRRDPHDRGIQQRLVSPER